MRGERSEIGAVLRIGHYVGTLPEPGRKPGGVEVFVDRLADKLAERGHEVTVFTCAADPAPRRYRRVRIARAGLGANKLARDVLLPLILNRIDGSELDVLHLHGDDWFYVRRAVPTVRTFHGSALHEARHAARLPRKVRRTLTYAGEVLASRLATASYSVGPEPAPGYRLDGLLPLGANPVDGRGSSAREARPTLLFVGTWEGRKRGAWLTRRFLDEVLPRIPSAQLWLVADRAEPHAAVRHFAAPSDEELAALYDRAWAFCLPSTYEGLGMPYLEAMAHGTPVVASPNPGARFVLADGAAGEVVEDGELADAIVRVLSDPERRRRLAEAGLRRIADFSWERVLEAHERAYAAAIATGRRCAAAGGG